VFQAGTVGALAAQDFLLQGLEFFGDEGACGVLDRLLLVGEAEVHVILSFVSGGVRRR
jgi:hypothetical protein